MIEDPNPPKPAACYVRRSTGLQYYSIEHQLTAIETFAEKNRYEIVRTFKDEKSGLTLKGRPGLKALLSEALSGRPEFEAILIYDVSRWGRFQDLDQGAHLEFLCRRSGIKIEYCNEPFENNGSPESNLIKQIKRSIAAEYSRDLSQRLTRARLAIAAKGYHSSGRAPFGLRRMVVDQEGVERGIMEAGQRKILAEYRTILTLGPEYEINIVRQIFNMFVHENMSRAAIARKLNERGLTRNHDAIWARGSIAKILRNRIYIGELVFGRTMSILHSPRRLRPEEEWAQIKGVVPAIIDLQLFKRAQERMQRS